MPKQDNDIFEFNPTRFWKELVDYQHKDFISIVDEDSGKNVLIPVSKLETEDEEQIPVKAKKFYRQYKFIEKNLEPEKIEELVQWLREDSNYLNLTARQLAFLFIRLYENLIQIHLKKTQDKLDLELPPFTPIFDGQKNLAFVRLDLDDAKTDKILKHLKQDLTRKFEEAKIWEKIAKEVLVYLALPTIKRIRNDLGDQTVDQLIAEGNFNTFQPYFSREKLPEILRCESLRMEIHLVLQRISLWLDSNIARSFDYPNLTLPDLDRILGFKQDNENQSIPVTESRLTSAILPFPTFAGIGSAALAQIRKDKWQKDSNGFAYFKHQSKGNPKNYIEHYISNPGDIELLPLEQAEQIIDKFGFNTVKLHLIFAAHTMKQERPWDSKFSLKASDIIKYLGWDKRTDLPLYQKLNEIAKTAFVLDCLLVKSVWVEGRNEKGGIDASTPTGRMWNVVVDLRGKQNSEGKVEQPKEVYITVQPGLIFYSFLNKAGSRLKTALYQFGYLAQDILRIDPYHQELALRLAIHLAIDSRIHVSGQYRVETLLKHLLPHTVIDTAREDKRKGYDLKQRWDNALKLLKELNWQIQFDESYPEWLQPGSKAKKPESARKIKIIEWLLQAKITIHPPEPIPELLANKVQPKPKAKKPKQISATATRLTSEQIRKGRNVKGWSQRKLAGWLGVSDVLIGYWEKGKRTPSEEMEKKLRELLQIED
ncbi:MAG: helix-turn-helix domain-containing protein [Waterburya sp.]